MSGRGGQLKNRLRLIRFRNLTAGSMGLVLGTGVADSDANS